ncbi:MAG: hypothetical protein C0392_00835 [Syntrophus sp. (in: bacteria)]|nr:hypothetical protein [Syntrophus sp. (in: bacteria)]
MWHVDELIKAVNGTPFRIERDTFASISTDSRTIGAEELFIPLTGNNFDGHLYIEKAYMQSHGGTICEKKRADMCANTGGTTILVDDTTRALLDLARWKRAQMSGTCIALTGSNGKTTTKEILVSMIQRVSSVAYNEKNYNNLIGVSKSILSISGKPAFFVFELGTNSPGEIKALSRTAQPDISLITNINPSHLEGLFDLEGILQEKLDLFYHTKEGGKVFINADDPCIAPAYKDLTHSVCLYALTSEAPFSLSIIRDLGWQGFEIALTFQRDRFQARTHLLGIHNLYNILAASALAWTIGIDKKEIAEGIAAFRPFDMRFTPIESRKGYMVIDDAYNANPASMEWALRTLEVLPCQGKRIAIIGDMKELGDKTAHYHRELGRFLKKGTISMILLIGDSVKETFKELGAERSLFFEDKGRLIDYVASRADKGDVILVKGSRASKMEEIVEALI